MQNNGRFGSNGTRTIVSVVDPLPQSQLDDAADPDAVARQSFAVDRRGFDQDQVRAYLRSVSASLRDAQAREADMRARLGKAVRRADTAEQAVREANANTVTDADLSRQVGDEVTSVLDAAHAAGKQRIAAAEKSAAQILANAKTEAAEVRRKADDVMAVRSREADEAGKKIYAKAQAQAKQVRDEADRKSAEQIQATVDRIALAQQEGDALIREAEEARMQILLDMDRRRRDARAQVARLRVGRDRLLRSYEAVRRSLDETTADLKLSLPEAKIKGDSEARRLAAEPLLTAEQLEAEMADARTAGLVADRLPPAKASTDDVDGAASTAQSDTAAAPSPSKPSPSKPALQKSEPQKSRPQKTSSKSAASRKTSATEAQTAQASSRTEANLQPGPASAPTSRSTSAPKASAPKASAPGAAAASESERRNSPKPPTVAPQIKGGAGSTSVKPMSSGSAPVVNAATVTAPPTPTTSAATSPATSAMTAAPAAPTAPVPKKPAVSAGPVSESVPGPVIATAVVDEGALLLAEPKTLTDLEAELTETVDVGVAEHIDDAALRVAETDAELLEVEALADSNLDIVELNDVVEQVIALPVATEAAVLDEAATQPEVAVETEVELASPAKQAAAADADVEADVEGAAPKSTSLFAALRSRTTDASPAPEPELVADGDSVEVAAAAVTPADADSAPEADATVDPAVEQTDEPTPQAVDAAVQAKRAVAGRLNRALADEQNDLLSGIGSSKQTIAMLDILGDVDTHIARFIVAIRGAAESAWTTAASSAGSDTVETHMPAAAVEELIEEELVGPIRARLGEVDTHDDVSSDDQIDAVRAFYRQRKTDHLPALAEHIASMICVAARCEATHTKATRTNP